MGARECKLGHAQHGSGAKTLHATFSGAVTDDSAAQINVGVIVGGMRRGACGAEAVPGPLSAFCKAAVTHSSRIQFSPVRGKHESDFEPAVVS